MHLKALFVVAFSLLLTACAGKPQQQISLQPEVLQGETNKVGIVIAGHTIANTSFPGASCLLCLAAAEVANSDLTSYAKTLSSEDFTVVSTELSQTLTAKGVENKVISRAIDWEKLAEFETEKENYAKKDLRPLKSSLGVDKLLVLDVLGMGFTRPYSSYFPTGDAQAIIFGKLYMVDLATNGYVLYKDVGARESAKGEWDEPPKFPGLTDAYYRALEKLEQQAIKNI